MKKTDNYFLSLLIIMFILSSCNKDDKITTPNLEEQLIGRWQAVEYSWINSNGIREFYTFGPNGDFPVEYSIGIDYSSGFELKENNILDLIWGGSNKEQFFSWNVIDEHIIIDEGTLDFTVLSVNEFTLELEFDNGKQTYKMTNLE